MIGSDVWRCVKRLIASVLLWHAFSGELRAVSIVNEAVEDCVAKGGVGQRQDAEAGPKALLWIQAEARGDLEAETLRRRRNLGAVGSYD